MSALKAGREPDLTEPLGVTTEINLHVPALLPERYCERRARAARALQAARERGDGRRSSTRIQEELVDRFGPLPDPAQALLASHRLRLARASRSA